MPAPPRLPDLTGLTLLVVDDDEDNVDMLSTYLTACGAHTLFARSGLTLAELQTIYRIQFPVMRQYEADTWYDQRGRIIFTNNSQGLPGVGLPRAEWNEVRMMTSGTFKRTVTDTTLPTGPVERQLIYHAPFTRCDRESDYASVWRKLDQVS